MRAPPAGPPSVSLVRCSFINLHNLQLEATVCWPLEEKRDKPVSSLVHSRIFLAGSQDDSDGPTSPPLSVPVFLIPLHTISAPGFFCLRNLQPHVHFPGPLNVGDLSSIFPAVGGAAPPAALTGRGQLILRAWRGCLLFCASPLPWTPSALLSARPGGGGGVICTESRVQPGNTRETSRFTPESCTSHPWPHPGCRCVTWRGAWGGLCSVLAGVSYLGPRLPHPHLPACARCAGTAPSPASTEGHVS